jgi:hypothetical protein
MGILIFAPYFELLAKKGLGYIRQWVASFLLGTLNIEQTKTLHYSSMRLILGQYIKTPYNQRVTIKKMATKNNKDHILRFNGELVKASSETDFYYDPHTKHYTGHLKILATWCPSVRLADKGINMDFIHTTQGHPVYFNTTDNFYDLRERFYPNIKQFRSLINFGPDKCLTIIIDRGIFSKNVFEQVVRSPTEHIITWEKGYECDKWDGKKKADSGNIIRTRNHSKDKHLVNYQFQERLWDKDTRMRQIIVRVMDKNRKVSIEVSILTDDLKRDTKEIINLMLKRWVQENDFKYMKKHFGINEITTYAFIGYKDLRDKIEDKLYTCGQHKKLTKQIKTIRAKLKTCLLREYQFYQKHPDINNKLSEKEKERIAKIQGEKQVLDKQLKGLEQERKDSVEKVSKIEELIEEGYQKLDTDVKSFVDAIKILSRNMFYLAFEPFKEKYDNYRDDHVLFRNFLSASGIVNLKSEEKKEVKLIPTMEYPRRIKKHFDELLTEFNTQEHFWPNGKKHKFELFLNK